MRSSVASSRWGLKLAIEVLLLGFAPAPEAEVAHESPCLLSGFHEEADRPGELSPLRVLARQPFLSGSSQSVVPGFPIAIGHRLPPCGDNG